jgi:hypothetical protein
MVRITVGTTNQREWNMWEKLKRLGKRSFPDMPSRNNDACWGTNVAMMHSAAIQSNVQTVIFREARAVDRDLISYHYR